MIKMVLLMAFSNLLGRITGCRDHPDVVKVCAKAKEPCFCAEHEFYTYAYCRKSCKFCDTKSKGMSLISHLYFVEI